MKQSLRTGLDDLPQHSDDTVCMLLIETRRALENIASSGRVEGVGCMIIAPFDLAMDLGGAALSREQTHAMLARGDTIPV
jgi:2-keto-3-deoxy-L-rhamnonate aldolase RhmA